MIISREYGPQFDPSDGTIGEHQLVKRWLLVEESGKLFRPQQGRYTYATEEEAGEVVKLFRDANPEGSKYHELTAGLRAIQWWCDPVHHDPRYPLAD